MRPCQTLFETDSQNNASSNGSSKNITGDDSFSEDDVMEVDEHNRKRVAQRSPKDSDTSDLSFDDEEQLKERLRLEKAKKVKRSTSTRSARR